MYHYSDTEELLKIVEQELMARLGAHYPPNQRVPPQPYTLRNAPREILEQKRKGSVGRLPQLQRLQEFATSAAASNYCAIHAVAGTGKSHS